MPNALIFGSGCTNEYRTAIETAAKKNIPNHTVIPYRLIHFSNQELKPELLATVRGLDISIVQQFAITSNSSNYNADLLMELFMLIHTCKISFARKVIVIAPIFPFQLLRKELAEEMTTSLTNCDQLTKENLITSRLKDTNPINDIQLIFELVKISGADTIITMEGNRLPEELPSTFIKEVSFFSFVFDQILCLYPKVNWKIGKNELIDEGKLNRMLRIESDCESNGCIYLVARIDSKETDLMLNCETSIAICLELTERNEMFNKIFVPDFGYCCSKSSIEEEEEEEEEKVFSIEISNLLLNKN